MTLGPGINQEGAQKGPRGPVPFDRPTDRATLEQLFSAAADGPVQPDDHRPKRSRRRTRRQIVVACTVLAVILGAAAGGWAWTTHAAKQPALKALRAGNAVFEPTITKLRLAVDLDRVRAAAKGAEAAADRIDSAARPVTQPTSNLERRVLAVLRGEAAVLRATAGMADLDIQTLGQWPGLRSRVDAAENGLEADVRRLAAVDADAASTVRTGQALAVSTTEVIGDFAETSVESRLDDHLEDLTQARTTREVREAAARTARSGETVTLALKGLDKTSPQGTQVVGVGDTLEAVGKLERLDGDHLQLWKPIRGDLLSSSEDLEGVDTMPALAALDALVAGAQKKLRVWRAATAKATARAERDTARLDKYLEATRPALQTYQALTKTSSEFSARVLRGEKGGITYQTASGYLDQTRKDLSSVKDVLTAVTVLPQLRAEHKDIVDVVDQSTEAVRGGYAGIRRPLGCVVRPRKVAPADENVVVPDPVCYYGLSQGWMAFRTGWDGAVQQFATSRTAWETAASDRLAAIEARALPEKPVV